MKLTKRQREYIEGGCSKGSYIAYPSSIFKSDSYKKWLKDRRPLKNKELTIFTGW